MPKKKEAMDVKLTGNINNLKDHYTILLKIFLDAIETVRPPDSYDV